MGILSKLAVEGTLKVSKNGLLYLKGKMSNGKECIVNLLDTTNNTKKNVSKEIFLSNMVGLIQKSNTTAIEKAKEKNDTAKIEALEQDLKNRLAPFQKEDGKIKLLIEEATGTYSYEKDIFSVTANVMPNQTKKGFIFHNIKPIEDNKNNKEFMPIKTTVYGMTYKREEFDKLSAEQKANLKYIKGSDDAQNWRYKNISVSDVQLGNIDYSTVQLKASLSKFAKPDDMSKVYELDDNYLNYVSSKHNKEFVSSRSRFKKDTSVLPKVATSVSQATMLNLTKSEDIKDMVVKFVNKISDLLSKQIDKQTNKPREYFVTITDGEKRMNINKHNIANCDKHKIALVYEAMIHQCNNSISGAIEFLEPNIRQEIEFIKQTKEQILTKFKELDKKITLKELYKQIATGLKKISKDNSDSDVEIYFVPRAKALENFELIQKIDGLRTAKNLKEFQVAKKNVLKYFEANQSKNLPLYVNFPLKTFDFDRKDDIEYSKRFTQEMKDIVENMAKDVLNPIKKTALSIMLNKSENPYLGAMKDNLSKYIDINREANQVEYKKDENGFTFVDRLMLKNLEANVEKPNDFYIDNKKQGETIESYSKRVTDKMSLESVYYYGDKNPNPKNKDSIKITALENETLPDYKNRVASLINNNEISKIAITTNNMGISALVIPKDLTKQSFVSIDGVGGRNFGYPENNLVYSQIIGAKYISVPLERLNPKTMEVDYDSLPQIPFNPLTGEEVVVKPKRTRRSKAEMEALRENKTNGATENISTVEHQTQEQDLQESQKVDINELESNSVTSDILMEDEKIQVENIPTSFVSDVVEVAISDNAVLDETNLLMSISNDGLDLDELSNFLDDDLVFDDRSVNLQALNDANQKNIKDTVIETSIAPSM